MSTKCQEFAKFASRVYVIVNIGIVIVYGYVWKV